MIVGRTLPTGREIAWHEAHHAAALLVAGMTPKCVRIDWPTADEAGATIVDWGDGVTPDSARHVLIAVLLGGMAEGLHGWQEWPIDADRVPTNARRDAEQAAVLASY